MMPRADIFLVMGCCTRTIVAFVSRKGDGEGRVQGCFDGGSGQEHSKISVLVSQSSDPHGGFFRSSGEGFLH